jgi:hypothetical protein
MADELQAQLLDHPLFGFSVHDVLVKEALDTVEELIRVHTQSTIVVSHSMTSYSSHRL